MARARLSPHSCRCPFQPEPHHTTEDDLLVAQAASPGPKFLRPGPWALPLRPGPFRPGPYALPPPPWPTPPSPGLMPSQVLMIDEVSMLSGEFLDLLDEQVSK